jgi:hypothetical protein
MPSYTQCEHNRINAREYPGTRQICVECEEPTERCEDDSIFSNDTGPLCIDCYNKINREKDK